MKANQSIEKAMLLIRAVTAAPDRATTGRLAEEVGLPRPTVTRLLQTMERCGYLDRDPMTQRYALGFDLMRMTRLGDPLRGLLERARPILAELMRELDETVTLTVPGPHRTLELVAQLDAPHLVGSRSWIGVPLPLHASSTGKLLLADLEEDELSAALAALELTPLAARTLTTQADLREDLARVRAHRYGMSVDEWEDGLAGLSMAARGPDDGIIAMISISGPVYRYDADARARSLAPLRAAVTALERELAPLR
jgi:DNA-binding IclR family transcriptional regulator